MEPRGHHFLGSGSSSGVLTVEVRSKQGCVFPKNIIRDLGGLKGGCHEKRGEHRPSQAVLRGENSQAQESQAVVGLCRVHP